MRFVKIDDFQRIACKPIPGFIKDTGYLAIQDDVPFDLVACKRFFGWYVYECRTGSDTDFYGGGAMTKEEAIRKAIELIKSKPFNTVFVKLSDLPTINKKGEIYDSMQEVQGTN